MKKRTFKKEKKFSRTCDICAETFKAADIKAHFCPSCKEPRPCKCGCGKLVKKPGSYYWANHQKKGKTYLEIYGTTTPACGAKPGELNTAKRPEIRAKISEGVKRSYQNNPSLIQKRSEQRTQLNLDKKFQGKVYKNSYGESYRSMLEVNFSELLHRHGIEFDYERPVKMINGRYKFVDFVVGNVYIEISGYVYESWQKDFDQKIKTLRQTIDNPILIFTYPQHLTYEKIQKIADENISFASIYDDTKMLNLIKFYEKIYTTNKEIIDGKRIHDAET